MCQALFLNLFRRQRPEKLHREKVLNQNALLDFYPRSIRLSLSRFVKNPLAVALPFPQRFL
jgi:hypothetical protein